MLLQTSHYTHFFLNSLALAYSVKATNGMKQDAELELGAPGKKKIGRHEAALRRSLTEKSCAQPLILRCCSQLFCQLSLAQSKVEMSSQLTTGRRPGGSQHSRCGCRGYRSCD